VGVVSLSSCGQACGLDIEKGRTEEGEAKSSNGDDGLLLFCSTPHTPHNSTHTHHIYTACYSPLPCRLELTQERGCSGAAAWGVLLGYSLFFSTPSSSCSWHPRSPPTHDAYTGRPRHYSFGFLATLRGHGAGRNEGLFGSFVHLIVIVIMHALRAAEYPPFTCPRPANTATTRPRAYCLCLARVLC